MSQGQSLSLMLIIKYLLGNLFEIKRHLTTVCSSKVCTSRNCLLLQLWTSLFYQGWLNSILGCTVIQRVWVKYRHFFIRPILESLLKCDWKLTSENCFIIGITLKKGCSLSKVSEVTKLQEVITRLSVARLFRFYFSPQSPNILNHLTLEIGFLYSLTSSNSNFRFHVTVTLTISHVLFSGLKQVYRDVWSFSMAMQPLTAQVGHKRCCSPFTGNIWTIELTCWNNCWEIVDFAIMGKFEWPYGNGCDWKSPISTAKIFLKKFVNVGQISFNKSISRLVICYTFVRSI